MLKHLHDAAKGRPVKAAAFRRLCVETGRELMALRLISPQPPSGGCVLKQTACHGGFVAVVQPPSGGCVLKHFGKDVVDAWYEQPPSGGCVLKPAGLLVARCCIWQPPSGGCVLKLSSR